MSITARIFAAAWLLAAWCLSTATAQAADFTVEAVGAQDYTINGAPDPGIVLQRGKTYTFAVNTSGHPFYIKTVQGAGTLNVFATGVTGNGVEIGTLTFAVPASAPNQLFYQCSVHNAMSGAITMVNAGAVPAHGPFSALVLALLLAGSGVLYMQRQRVRERVLRVLAAARA
jgi:hypothetical protein